MEQYASLGRGAAYREVLIKEMDRSSVRVVKTSLYEHALLTSEPDECLRIEALRAAKSTSSMTAIRKVFETHPETIATYIEDLTPDEIDERMKSADGGSGGASE